MDPEATDAASAPVDWPIQLLLIWGVLIIAANVLGLGWQVLSAFLVFWFAPDRLGSFGLAALGHVALMLLGLGLAFKLRAAVLVLALLALPSLVGVAYAFLYLSGEPGQLATWLGVILLVYGPPLWVGFARWKQLPR
jgi:hypothetical protein